MTEEVEVAGIVAAGEEGNNCKKEVEEGEIGNCNDECKQGRLEAEQSQQAQ